MKTLLLAITVLVSSAPLALAQMNHSTMDHANMTKSAEAVEGAVHAKAVVNSLGDGTANVSHDPIPEIGWPAMTMDVALMPVAEMMGDIAAGDSVTLMLIKGEDGMYAIAAMMAE